MDFSAESPEEKLKLGKVINKVLPIAQKILPAAATIVPSLAPVATIVGAIKTR